MKLISTDFDGTLFAEFENPPIPRVLGVAVLVLGIVGFSALYVLALTGP